LLSPIIKADWLNNNLESLALNHASLQLVPEHFNEVKGRRQRQADKTLAAVYERLVKEINYWSDRYIKLKEDIKAGKKPKLQPEVARRRVDELTARLEQRKTELTDMKNVISSTPVVIGGALVIPQGLLSSFKGDNQFSVDAQARARIEKIAMNAVIKAEGDIGFITQDVSHQKCGWDITSRPQPNSDGSINPDRHIEVKGRSIGQKTITISRNEIIYGLNQADKFVLAIVIVEGDEYYGPHYIKAPFTQEPDFGVASINYELDELLAKAVMPEHSI
jgi:hypothetical protein